MNMKIITNLFIVSITGLLSVVSYAAQNDPAASPPKPVTEILPMTYNGEAGFMVTNCPSNDTACIISPAKNPTYFWVSTNDPLYETYLNMATASLLTGVPLGLWGTGTCTPACTNGYERLGWAKFTQ